MQIDFETNCMFALQRGNRFTHYTVLYMSKCQKLKAFNLGRFGFETSFHIHAILPGHPPCWKPPIRSTAPAPEEYAASTVNQPASQDGFEPTFFFVTWHINWHLEVWNYIFA